MTGLGDAVATGFVLTTDRDAARRFYCDVLGLTVVGEDEFAVVFQAGGMMLRLTGVEDHSPHAHAIIGWTVSDIADTVFDLSDRGVTFAIYPGLGQDELGIWTSPDGKTRVAWFSDPDGNVLRLTQG